MTGPAARMTPARRPSGAPGPGVASAAFRMLWLAHGVSMLGSMTTTVALPLLAVSAFDAGPLWMGALTAAVWVPWLVVGLPAGAWVDRFDPRRVMLSADLAASVAVVSVPVAWAFGLLTLPHLAVTAVATGTASVFVRSAAPVLLPRLVGADELAPANARLLGTDSAMQVAGPGVGGLLVGLASAAWALIADAVSFLVSAWCLHRLRVPGPRPEPPAREPLGREVAEGVRVVARDRYLRFFVVQGGVGNFALTGYGALLVLHAVRDLRLAPATVGVVLALGSTGGLVGAAVATRAVRRWGEARAMVALQVLGGPPALLVAVGRPGWTVALVPLGLALVGMGVVGANVIRAAFRMRYVPSHLLGRTLAAGSLVAYGTMPVAGLLAGWLGAVLGVRETIALMATLFVASSLVVLIGPYGRGRELPSQPMATCSSGSTATARKITVT
ncbi:MAG: MFS transporter [Dermatophilaceae bacterium]